MTPGTEELPTEMGALAGKLTEAQRRYMTVHASKDGHWCVADRDWVTYPPSNTHRVLIRLGLVATSGRITGLGLALRAHLQANPIPTSDSKDAAR